MKNVIKLDLVLTHSGIKDFSAISIISEIGADMTVFPTSKNLCSWAGLAPSNNESAGKKKSVRISRAGIYIKPLLVQCANAIVTSKKHPEIRDRYLSIKKRRGHKKAIIAITRMMLTTIYYILKNNEPYNPYFLKKANSIPSSHEITIDEAVAIIQRQGFICYTFF